MPLMDFTTPRKKKRSPFWTTFAASLGQELVRRQRLKDAFEQMQKEQEMMLQKSKQVAELQAMLRRETDRLRSEQDVQEAQSTWDIEHAGSPITPEFVADWNKAARPAPPFPGFGRPPSLTGTIPPPSSPAELRRRFLEEEQQRKAAAAEATQRQADVKAQREAAEEGRKAAEEGRKQTKFGWEAEEQAPAGKAKAAAAKTQAQAQKAADNIYQKILVAAGERADSTAYAQAAAAADTVLAIYGQPPKYGTGGQKEVEGPPPPPKTTTLDAEITRIEADMQRIGQEALAKQGTPEGQALKQQYDDLKKRRNQLRLGR